MSDLSGLLALLLPFFGLIALGMVSAKLARLPVAGLAWMQFFLVYCALPCLFFRLIGDKPIAELANWGFIAVTTGATAIVFTTAFLLSRAARRPTAENVMAAVAGAYSNIGYMGPPLVVSFLGDAGAAPVALIFVFDTLFLFTAVPALMSFAGVDRRPPLQTAGRVLRNIAFHPFMIATALGMAASFSGWRPPVALDTMTRWLSGAAAPCALFVLGVTVALRPSGRVEPLTRGLVGLKLVGHPVLVWLLMSWFRPAPAVWAETAIVMAALPPALNIFVLASQYRVAVERSSAALLLGTCLSLLSLTGLLWMLKSGLMPPLLFGP